MSLRHRISTVRFDFDLGEKISVLIVCLLFLAAFGVGYYILYGPGETRTVAGEVVSFETRYNDSARQILYVRLDNGLTVSTRIGAYATIKVGRRVNLVATRMPILGIERFQFKEFVDPPVDQNPLLYMN